MPKESEPLPHGSPAPNCVPLPGSANPSEEFNPTDVPDHSERDDPGEHPRPAPAPGVPTADQEYERLKEGARWRRKQPEAPAQEDTPRSTATR